MEVRNLVDSAISADHTLAATLQRSVLAATGDGPSNRVTTIASLMPKARASNTSRSNELLWKKWMLFCSTDDVDPLSGSESSLLRYLGWLYDTNTVSGSSVRNYVSAVVTSDTRLGKPLSLSPLPIGHHGLPAS